MPANNPNTLQDILKAIQDKKLPPVHLWNPDFCGDIDMRIGRDGTWFYMGTPIGRSAMVKLFSTVLRLDDDGKYYLVTPVEKLGIKVDDAPFLAVEMVREGSGAAQVLSFRTQTDDWVVANKTHPIRFSFNVKTNEPSPYILIRDNLEALINRPLFYDLVALAEHKKIGDKTVLEIASQGEVFRIGEL